jgi:predicted ATPase
MYYFENFKGFAKAELDITEPFTLLIGQNGAGKSNLIEAMELLAFIAHGGLLHEISSIGRGGRLEIRGGLAGCSRHSKNSFTLGFQVPVSPENSKGGEYKVTVQTTPTPRIIQESLKRYYWFDGADGQQSESLLFKTIDAQGTTANDMVVEYNNFLPGPNPTLTVPSNCSMLSRYEKLIQPPNEVNKELGVIQEVRRHLSAAFILDPISKLMCGYERIGNHQLAKNAANLSATLYALDQGNDEQKTALARLLEKIKQLPNEPYHQFEFVTTRPQLDDVIFGLKTGPEGWLTSAQLLSDGTLRCLAVLTALETVAPDFRLIIEEFDNGLHPSRVGMLINAIADSCQHRKLNVLVTTHNPATLNVLSQEQLKGVVLCAWDNVAGGAKLVKLLQLPRYEELLERGQLGDLVTRQVIDQYLLPNVEQQHQEKALKWLANLKQLRQELSS